MQTLEKPKTFIEVALEHYKSAKSYSTPYFPVGENELSEEDVESIFSTALVNDSGWWVVGFLSLARSLQAYGINSFSEAIENAPELYKKRFDRCIEQYPMSMSVDFLSTFRAFGLIAKERQKTESQVTTEVGFDELLSNYQTQLYAGYDGLSASLETLEVIRNTKEVENLAIKADLESALLSVPKLLKLINKEREIISGK